MRLLLIRHAVTAETGTKLSGRLPGIPLTAAGTAMAEHLAAGLKTTKVHAVYTSPILRCRQTAKPLAAMSGVRATTLNDVTEADYGSWSGRNLTALYRLKAWQRLMASASRFRFPDGETLEEVQRRSVAAVEALATRHRRETIAMVSHSDVIRVLLAHYLGMPLDLVHRLHVAPTSVSIIELSEGGRVAVPSINNDVAGHGGR